MDRGLDPFPKNGESGSVNLKIYDPKDFPTYLPKLNQLYDELLSGGKGFRAKLVTRVAGMLNLPPKTTHLLVQTVEFIHNASLLHDDLVDRSFYRRGKPAAWTTYGPEYAVLAGDYLLARVMVNLSGFGDIQLVHYTSLVISDLLEGEWLQDSLVRDFDVQLEELDHVHNLKTSSLFKWCLRAPFYASKNDNRELHELLEEMGALIGILFQRGDDLLDFDVRNDEKKSLLGDLKSGYLNSFAVYCTRHMKLTDRESLQNCQNLQEFKARIGGESFFLQKLAEFDSEAQNLIQTYQAYFEKLKDYLPKPLSEADLKFLYDLPDYMYWRKMA